MFYGSQILDKSTLPKTYLREAPSQATKPAGSNTSGRLSRFSRSLSKKPPQKARVYWGFQKKWKFLHELGSRFKAPDNLTMYNINKGPMESHRIDPKNRKRVNVDVTQLRELCCFGFDDGRLISELRITILIIILPQLPTGQSRLQGLAYFLLTQMML